MKRYIYVVLTMLAITSAAFEIRGALQATSQFTITFTFDGANQAAADLKRDNALVDFAKAYNLDIYTDATRTTVDPSKVGPAVRQQIRQYAKGVIVEYRAQAAGASAASTTRATENASINP